MGKVTRTTAWFVPALFAAATLSASCKGVDSIAVNPSEISFSNVGATLQLEAEPLDRRRAKVSGVPVTFQSRDPSIATVSPSGLVTAAGHGSATIVVQVEGTDVMEFVRVVVRLAKRVEVRPANTSVYIGGVENLTAKILDYDDKVIDNVSFTWSTSDDKIATVEKGTVTGIDEGNVVITAKGLEIEGQSNIRVLWEPRLKAVIEAEKRMQGKGGGGGRRSGGEKQGEWTDPRLGIFQD